jgi:hypothetical protein
MVKTTNSTKSESSTQGDVKGTALSLPGRECNLTTPPDWELIPSQAVCVTSIDVSSASGRRALFDCVEGDSEDSGQWINQEIAIEHVFFHVVQLDNDETGETRNCIRTVLITPDGKRIKFVSVGIVKALQLAAYAFGPLPWSPPRVFVLHNLQGKGKHKRLTLHPVE